MQLKNCAFKLNRGKIGMFLFTNQHSFDLTDRLTDDGRNNDTAIKINGTKLDL